MAPSRPSFRPVAWLLFAAVVVVTSNGKAQEAPLAGLLGTYADAAGNRVERVDRAVAFSWPDGVPDSRLASGPFSATWTGEIEVAQPGRYRLGLQLQGRATLVIGGAAGVLEAESEGVPRWFAGEPVELAAGRHPIELAYRSAGGPGRVALFWSGPGFDWEPVGDRPLRRPSEAPSSGFDRGRQLVRALRCAACHEVPGIEAVQPGPALDHLAGNLSPGWLVSYLMESAAEREHPENSRMPAVTVSPDEAADLAAYLLAGADRSSPASGSASNEEEDDESLHKRGRRLLLTTGCLACHTFEGVGSSGLTGGGDLTAVGEKRPPGFFDAWLEHPERLNADHRMPAFALENKDRRALAAFLAQTTAAPESESPAGLPDGAAADGAIERGQALFLTRGCHACHRGPDPFAPVEPTPLDARANWDRACSADPREDRQPRYALNDSDRAAIRDYVAQFRTHSRATATLDLLHELRCLECHERRDPGLAAMFPQLLSGYPKLESELPYMTPPSLRQIGDKLTDAALEEVLARSPRRRTWLKVRMPDYRLSESQQQRLREYLVGEDRVPAAAIDVRPPATPDARMLEIAGSRLVTSDGFGCTSCHAVGTAEPPPTVPGAQGPDLLLLGERIRRPWFDRFVRNPTRVVPRMEMPSVQLSVQGVLDDDLDRQLEAVWHVLNQPDFRPPRPNPVRVVRHSGLVDPDQGDPDARAAVITDVVRAGETSIVKPLLIGLTNRHNVLIDLEHDQLYAWTLGDTARQYTEGKTWYWELGGTRLIETTARTPELLLLNARGERRAPAHRGQFITEFDVVQHVGGGLRWRYRLHYPREGSDDPLVVTVDQALHAQDEQGIRRTVRMNGIPRGWNVAWRLGPEELALGRVEGDGLRRLDGDHVRLEPLEGHPSIHVGVARYRTTLTPDKFPPLDIQVPAPPPINLRVIPGFESTRLPLFNDLMPTAIDWTSEGTMLVASLKGRVWTARDLDDDGLEDALEVFSDDLAAPFGLAAHDDGVDVVNKYSLLRLWDEDGDGRADRMETLASGWGHTTDYHDWAVGLPRDDAGGYYVALACQQDQRSAAAARYRGQVLRLVPRSPTPADPHRFDIETISGGHRFPIGIARNRQGELFVTDNQGNYNPFNELNHVMPGARYGFLNAIERRDGFQPPLTPPAIDIPHPWTRSVNGICFLETPAALLEEQGPVFGPFEGHLVGCEYDTRRMIRMSLQRVGDTWQGAAYPWSLEKPDVEGETFLGPLCVAVAPDGDLYVGCIRDSGWGGGNNIGTLVRLSPRWERLPAGIREVRAVPGGLHIAFTRAFDTPRLAEPSRYRVESYTRVSTPAYGGPDQERRVESIVAARPDPDGLGVTLELGELRAGFVYDVDVAGLASGTARLHPATAFYTMRQVPVEPSP